MSGARPPEGVVGLAVLVEVAVRRIPLSLLACAALACAGLALGAQQAGPEARIRQIARDHDRTQLQPDVIYQAPDSTLQLGVRCATRTPDVRERALIGRELDRHVARAGDAHRSRQLEIPVVFHVVRKRNGKFDVDDERVQAQIDVLNAAFAPHGYVFRLEEIRRVADNRFASKCLRTPVEKRFKRKNAVDPATTLNVYSCRPSGGILGYAYFPTDYAEDDYRHGVVINHSTLPGGSAEPYDLGDTLVHEVGHYLGLFHTFERGCNGRGDRVADTPAEAEPVYGCPRERDSCPGPGTDPISNFMNYTDDACMFEFTAGQEERMDDQVALFRPRLGS